jgi:hypothetical protein
MRSRVVATMGVRSSLRGWGPKEGHPDTRKGSILSINFS